MKFWAAAVMLLVVSGTGCRKKNTDNFQVTGGGKFSQVLKDFQMQDILNGQKNMVVESVEGRLIDKEQAVDVDQPRVTFYKNGAVSSHLVAPKGRVALDTHEVIAWGGVTVVTPDSATLTTERLRYNPENQHLMSNDPVRLEREDSITLGESLDADPDLNRVRIGKQKVHVKPRRK